MIAAFREPTGAIKMAYPTNKTRRTALQRMALGGTAVSAKVFPQAWTRPVIDSVILPAHAQTTREPTDDGEPTNGAVFTIDCNITTATQNSTNVTLIVEVTPTNNVDPTDNQTVGIRITYTYQPENVPVEAALTLLMNSTANPPFTDTAPAGQTSAEVLVEFIDVATFGSETCTDSSPITQI